MAHLRKALRDNVVAALSGLATTGSRVHASRVHPVGALPALLIFMGPEAIVPDNMGSPRNQARSLQIFVDAVVEATAAIDDVIDQIVLEVEAALTADVTRGGLAKDTQLAAIDIAASGDGEKPVMTARMVWDVDYRTANTDPSAAT